MDKHSNNIRFQATLEYQAAMVDLHSGQVRAADDNTKHKIDNEDYEHRLSQ